MVPTGNAVYMTAEAQIVSEAIREAVAIATAAGNRIAVIATHWRPKQVVFMDHPISQKVRSQLLALSELERVIQEPTPHNPATEDFVDRARDVVVAFPALGENRRWY